MEMPSQLVIRNSQRDRRIDTSRLRQAGLEVLDQLKVNGEVYVHLVSARRMAQLNRRYLQHEGATDVITFDYGSTAHHLHGELFLCVAEAVRHAKEFKTSWPGELIRYLVHGILHLKGYDDHDPARRRKMRRKENELMKRMNDEL